jgi:PIN domain nuclease of toxin-antitoxin system
VIVLDTNVVYRLMTGVGRLGEMTRQALDDAPERVCSTMVQWELAMLASKGRLIFHRLLDRWIEDARVVLRFADAPVTATIARDAGSLRGWIHGDLCDRIMIATARSLGCPLMTVDRQILAYAEEGHVQAIDARR